MGSCHSRATWANPLRLSSTRCAMRRPAIVALVTLAMFAFPLPSWCTGPSPIHIPARGESGWQFSPPNDRSQGAPSGYEGRTDTSTLTAVGNTPATAGKRSW
jgi:hypothetical protein